MIIIDISILKEMINDVFLAEYYEAASIDELLENKDWKELWEERKSQFLRNKYADFDVVETIFRNSNDFEFLTWNNSRFGNINNIKEIFDELYIDKTLDRNGIWQKINLPQKPEHLYLLVFKPIPENLDKKNLI